jgi:arylsulfatase A-like enzyme
LFGDDSKQQKHDFLYWEFHETDQIGVRVGDWKLLVKKGTPYLYDLANDVHEDHDIAAAHPDIVKQMKEIKGGSTEIVRCFLLRCLNNIIPVIYLWAIL